jgi:hypothetical protein
MALDPRDYRAWMRTKREGYWKHAHHDTRRTDRYPLPFIIFTEDVVRFTRWTGEQELGLHTHLLGETAY